MREPKVALTPPHNAGLEAVIRAIGRLLTKRGRAAPMGVPDVLLHGTFGGTGEVCWLQAAAGDARSQAVSITDSLRCGLSTRRGALSLRGPPVQVVSDVRPPAR